VVCRFEIAKEGKMDELDSDTTVFLWVAPHVWKEVKFSELQPGDGFCFSMPCYDLLEEDQK
jgi:hypothetical protein